MKTLIKSSNLTKAHLMDFAEVMRIIAAFLEKEDLEALKLTAVANEFTAKLAELEKGLVQARKTGLTESIAEADQVRNDLFVGLYSVLKGMSYFPEKTVGQMADDVLLVIDKYDKHINRLPQREETSVLSNLLTDLKADTYKEHVKR